jgi:hypothetical protein
MVLLERASRKALTGNAEHVGTAEAQLKPLRSGDQSARAASAILCRERHRGVLARRANGAGFGRWIALRRVVMPRLRLCVAATGSA